MRAAVARFAVSLPYVAKVRARLQEPGVHEIEPATASEDFGLVGAAWDVPAAFWVLAASTRRHSRRPNRRASSTRFRPITRRISHR